MKRKFLFFIAAIALGIVIPISVFAASNWHCCIEPSCTDCQHELLGCNCELREKLGLDVCSECSAAGCGVHEHAEMKESYTHNSGGCEHAS